MSFSKIIKEICSQEGLTLKEFSEVTGISYQQVRNYSSGRKIPNYENLLRISNAPNLSKYRTALLGDDNAVDAEIMRLIQELTERGQEQQVLALLKEFQSEEQSSDPADDDAQKE